MSGKLLYRLGLWAEGTVWLNRLITGIERRIKNPIFGCKMCGQCALSQTALTCPMTCPKELRNGPCGGSVGGRCEVYPDLSCVWTVAYRRSRRIGRDDAFRRLMLPVDRTLAGRSSLLNHFVGRDAHTFGGRDLPEPPVLPTAEPIPAFGPVPNPPARNGTAAAEPVPL